MKPILVTAALCLVIGFASGWFAKSRDISEKELVQRPDTVERTRSTSRVIDDGEKARASLRKNIPGGKLTNYSKSKEKMKKTERKDSEMLRKQFRSRFNQRIAAINSELNLNSDQEKALRGFFDRQLAKINFSNSMKGDADKKTIMATAAALRGDGLRDYMASYLDTEQMKALDAFQERKRNSRIEARALKEFAKLQQDLNLRDDQKDKAYALIAGDVEKQLEAQSDADYVFRAVLSSTGLGIDVGDMDMDMGEMMALKDGQKPRSPAVTMNSFREKRQKRINEKIALLAPVLDEPQLKRYRKNLEKSGGLLQQILMSVEKVEDEGAGSRVR